MDGLSNLRRTLYAVIALLSLLWADFAAAFTLNRTPAVPTGVWEEAEAEEPQEPEETEVVAISDRLSLPRVTKSASVPYLTAGFADLTAEGESVSLQAEAFAEVFDKVIVFRAGEEYRTAYVLGEPAETDTYLIHNETGYYIALSTVEAIFGGAYSETADGATLIFGDKAVTVTDGKAYLHGAEQLPASGGVIECLTGPDGAYRINVKDAAALTGLTVYYTDAGLVFFSLGDAFDPLRGYYIAEEAEKLYLTGDEAAAYSADMFVDIPHIVKSSDTNVTAYTYPALDLNANVTAYALQGVKARVALGPAIVVGEGESRDNHTVVRVFDAYQTLHTQFSAYPAAVTGGVQVAAAHTDGGFAILTAPYAASSVKLLRCYDADGSLLFTVRPGGAAPYAIAAGAFLGDGDVFAVMSRNSYSGSRTIQFFSAEDGSLLGGAGIATELYKDALLAPGSASEAGESLLLYADGGAAAYEWRGGALTGLPLDCGDCNGVYASAFGGYLATGDAADLRQALSHVTVYRDGEAKEVDVGERENLFISTAAKKNAAYVKMGQFWHTRLEFASAAHSNTRAGDTASVRVNDIASFTVTPGGDVQSKYNTQYNMWEPCTTHRWNKTAGMGNLISYTDPDTGLYGYATLTKENQRSDYLELGSSYFNGTYAPYIEAMDRFNYWTRRTYLRELAVLYRDAPEYTAAVSPVHEHEIDSGASSVGDYNPKMIAGFRLWLEERCGTVENVNRLFGTSFASFAALDAPRDAGRGDWDRYPASSGDENPFFTQWSLYNRTIVSQRIIESYREALLAGFPPELIKAHQIPEGDAVGGFLGEADTRISPVDVVLAAGTAYGGTRYFTWFRDDDSFLSLAADSGQHNTTLGEYSAMNTRKLEAYRQLKFLFDNGVMFTHVMSWAGGAEDGDKMDASEQYAIDRLQKEDKPRSASSGGTGDVRAYTGSDTAYNIVEIGSKKDSAGLLKSVNEDGSFEGTVYLQPFHAAVVPVTVAGGDNVSGTGRLRYEITGRTDAKGKAMAGLNYGDTVDLRLTAAPAEGEQGTLTVRVWHEGCEEAVDSYTFTVTGEETEYRYVFRNQVYLPDCRITVTYRNVTISDSDVTLLFERTARKYYGELSPQAHTGGVSFDLLY